MDFFEVVNARRSVRNYLPEPVEREALERIVSAGVARFVTAGPKVHARVRCGGQVSGGPR